MSEPQKTKLSHYALYVPIWLTLKIGRLIPFDRRVQMVGSLGAVLVRRIPALRNRALHQIDLIFPDMPIAEKYQLCAEVGRNTGRTLAETLNNDELMEKSAAFNISGPGLTALKQAMANKTGAIIVSGHFGQWEAIRHVMRRLGCPTGAVYKPNANPLYERLFLNQITKGGEPIVPTGAKGTREMVRHIRSGGFFALLPDQRLSRVGKAIPFLGHDAPTSTSAAELALRYNLPLIPAYGTRSGNSVDVEFEAPIKHTDAITMTRAINDSLSDRVRKNPEQWYWLHHRWNKPKR